MIVRSVGPAEAYKLIAEDPLIKILDVREQWEYELVHLPNALLIPLSDFINRINSLEKDLTYLVYCHHGSRSMRAAMYMSSVGFTNLLNLKGGINACAREVDKSLNIY